MDFTRRGHEASMNSELRTRNLNWSANFANGREGFLIARARFLTVPPVDRRNRRRGKEAPAHSEFEMTQPGSAGLRPAATSPATEALDGPIPPRTTRLLRLAGPLRKIAQATRKILRPLRFLRPLKSPFVFFTAIARKKNSKPLSTLSTGDSRPYFYSQPKALTNGSSLARCGSRYFR